jgi:predicted  nucleic acid-binding Zn-ribbon protein
MANTSPGYQKSDNEEIELLQCELKTCKTSKLQLEKDLASKDDELAKRQKTIAEQNQEIKRLQDQLVNGDGDRKRLIEQYERTIADQTTRIRELEKELAEIKGKPERRPKTWPDRMTDALKTLSDKRYGPVIEHSLTLITGLLTGYGIK